MLIDVMQYKPKLLVAEDRVAPKELGIEAEPVEFAPPEQPPVDLKDMAITESSLKQPIHLPPKARFIKGPHIHI